MLNDEICKKRDELNKSIEDGDEYNKIYKLSIELDELIAKYYNINPDIKTRRKKQLVKIKYNKNAEEK